MILRKYFLLTSIFSFAFMSAAYRSQSSSTEATEEVCGNDEKRCKDLNDSCKCYCAYRPGPRDKKADDKPIFIKDDPDGHYCYCKQRDIDKHLEDKEKQLEDQENDYGS